MPVVGPGHGLNMMKVTQLHVRIYKVTATTLDFEHDYPLQGGKCKGEWLEWLGHSLS